MKSLYLLFLVLLQLTLFSEIAHCQQDLLNGPKRSKYQEIGTEDLSTLMKVNSSAKLIDTRESALVDGKRIPEAILLSLKASDAEIKNALPALNSVIIVYCQNKDCDESEKMAQKLSEMGYLNVIRYKEGLDGWENSGNLIELFSAPTKSQDH